MAKDDKRGRVRKAIQGDRSDKEFKDDVRTAAEMVVDAALDKALGRLNPRRYF